MQHEHATHSREHSPAQDSELESIKASLREMQSKVHQALSSAPEIDRVLEETQRTPFTDRITAVPIRQTTKLRIESFGGTTNPKHFMTSFAIAMGRIQLSPEEREAAYCQLFVEHLVGSALDWFSRLRPSSIGNFAQLSTAFFKHYSMYIQDGASEADLWALAQGPRESLRDYMCRFKAILSTIDVQETSAIGALKNGLWHESGFRADLILHKALTLTDAMHRATSFVLLEEDRATNLKKHSPAKPTPAKPKAKDILEIDHNEPFLRQVGFRGDWRELNDEICEDLGLGARSIPKLDVVFTQLNGPFGHSARHTRAVEDSPHWLGRHDHYGMGLEIRS